VVVAVACGAEPGGWLVDEDVVLLVHIAAVLTDTLEMAHIVAVLAVAAEVVVEIGW